MDWNTLLFAGKWAIIGLVYFTLFILLTGVYRELSSRVGTGKSQSGVSFGKLRVIRPGSDTTVQAGSILPLKPETRLGASPGNDIVLHDKYVSGMHAMLRWDGAGWMVEDLNSRNGTFVNRKPCPPRQPQPLPSGATLEIGDMAFEVLD